MNCDPDRPRKPGGRALMRLREAGWQVPAPDGSWSFISKRGDKSSRIDHAICSPGISAPVATYVTRIAEIILAGQSVGFPVNETFQN